jgi:outer membrane protein
MSKRFIPLSAAHHVPDSSLIHKSKNSTALVSGLAVLCGIVCVGSGPLAHSENLAQIYQAALAHDPLYREARARFNAAKEQRPAAWAALLPHISASAEKLWDKSSGASDQVISDVNGALYSYNLSTLSHTNSSMWSVDFSDTLFSWKDWMALKGSEKKVAQARAQYQVAKEQLLLRTTKAYFGALDRIEQLHAQKSAYDALDYQLKRERAAYSVGLVAKIAVQQAEAARDDSAAAIVRDEQLLTNAQNKLQAITGETYASLMGPGDALPLIAPNPLNEQYWVKLSLSHNWTLIAKELSLDAARYTVRSTYGADLPEIQLIASRSYSNSISNQTIFGQEFTGLGTNDSDEQVGIEVTVPIFDGGADLANTHRAQYEENLAQAALTAAARGAREATENAYLGVLSGIANVKASSAAVLANKTAFNASQAGLKSGAESEMDYLNTLSNLIMARTQYARSRYTYLESIFALKKATGTLTPAAILQVNQWLTRPEAP